MAVTTAMPAPTFEGLIDGRRKRSHPLHVAGVDMGRAAAEFLGDVLRQILAYVGAEAQALGEGAEKARHCGDAIGDHPEDCSSGSGRRRDPRAHLRRLEHEIVSADSVRFPRAAGPEQQARGRRRTSDRPAHDRPPAAPPDSSPPAARRSLVADGEADADDPAEITRATVWPWPAGAGVRRSRSGGLNGDVRSSHLDVCHRARRNRVVNLLECRRFHRLDGVVQRDDLWSLPVTTALLNSSSVSC